MQKCGFDVILSEIWWELDFWPPSPIVVDQCALFLPGVPLIQGVLILLQPDPVGHYQLGQKNTVYLEMIFLGVQCMYFCAKPLQNQCILELVHYTK